MFLHNKYYTWYYNIVKKAFIENRKKKKGLYYESHHIIPKSMGGKAVVLLTAKEHFICHLLLPKMLTGSNKHKMINALIRMTFSKSKGQERYTARSFNIVRSMIAEKNSEIFKGKQKSEKVKANMKGRSGVYTRTTKNKENLSLAQKQRMNYGSNNAFYGKTHSEETKKHWSLLRKGKVPWNKGLTKKDYNHATSS